MRGDAASNRGAETYFAPSQRATDTELERDIALAGESPLMRAVLSTAGGLIAVLNEQRQLLVLNHAYLSFLGIEDPHSVLGLRPGEAVGCPNAVEGPGGCGTSKACRSCGAVIAILAAARSHQSAEADCALSASVEGVRRDIDLRVRAAPLKLGDRTFTLMFMDDVSNEKRREALEQAFLHDLNNVIQGLVGTADILAETAPSGNLELVENLHVLATRVCAEIAIQRVLAGSESYRPRLDRVDVGGLLLSVQRSVTRHPAALRKCVALVPPRAVVELRTDRILVERVLTNMAINALEATSAGGEVRMCAECRRDDVELAVCNDGVIAEDVRPRIFQRYFSTKAGAGRGQGTFTMKLFGERFLGGKVSFTSNEADGTAFVLQLPIHRS